MAKEEPSGFSQPVLVRAVSMDFFFLVVCRLVIGAMPRWDMAFVVPRKSARAGLSTSRDDGRKTGEIGRGGERFRGPQAALELVETDLAASTWSMAAARRARAVAKSRRRR